MNRDRAVAIVVSILFIASQYKLLFISTSCIPQHINPTNTEAPNALLDFFYAEHETVNASSLAVSSNDPKAAIASEIKRRSFSKIPFWRKDLAYLLNNESMKTGAEIGVQRGVFSEELLKNWKTNTKYILIDPWTPQRNYDDVANKNKDVQEQFYKEALDRLAPWREQIVVIRNFSHNAAALVPNNSLDFVYVDARHDFTSVLEDMEDWWPKLRHNGIFAGHDYCYANKKNFARQPNGKKDFRGVKGAVRHFAETHRVPYFVIPERWAARPIKACKGASWIMRK